MHNTLYLMAIVHIIGLDAIASVRQDQFVPQQNKMHMGQLKQSRQWGRWCSVDSECGLGFCQAYVCQCFRGYITWYFMDICAYEQRSKQTAFLVSFFVGTLGVDWFVLSKGNAGYIVAGIVKLIISLGCCVAWPLMLRNASKKSRQQMVLSNAINIIMTATSLIWWLTDWIRILSDVFYDGNGAPLQPWGYDYYDRYSYRL
jgi:hypothetical protein